MLPFETHPMAYAEKNLAPGESIVYRARYHWIYYRTSLAFLLVAAVSGLWWWISGERLGAGGASAVFGILAFGFLAAGVVHFIVRRIRASADEYVVTSRRVIRKYGLIAREVEQALIERVQDITIQQGIAARLLGYGTVTLETASETGRLVFPDIADPERFRSAIWGRTPGPGTAAPAAPLAAATSAGSVEVSAAARLAEVEALRKRGLLSDEEYTRKREEILKAL
jgi:membrane protein YdbS with pleckstrin-like domain